MRGVNQRGEISQIRLSMSTGYLIPCDGGYMQIDTGYESWDRLLEADAI